MDCSAEKDSTLVNIKEIILKGILPRPILITYPTINLITYSPAQSNIFRFSDFSS